MVSSEILCRLIDAVDRLTASLNRAVDTYGTSGKEHKGPHQRYQKETYQMPTPQKRDLTNLLQRILDIHTCDTELLLGKCVWCGADKHDFDDQPNAMHNHALDCPVVIAKRLMGKYQCLEDNAENT